MATLGDLPPAPDPRINPLVFYSLPPEEAQFQLEHVDDNIASRCIIASSVTLAVAIVAVILRFLSRRIKRVPYGADDWLMVAALAPIIAFTALFYELLLTCGGGRHLILSPDPIKSAKLSIAGMAMYAPAMGLIKLSTLVLYGRIFSFRGFRIILWTIAAFVTANALATIFMLLFQCHPISGAWDPEVRLRATCIDLKVAYLVVSGIPVLTDIALLLVPIPHLWRLQVTRTLKIQLMILFTIGSFLSFASIYKLALLGRLSVLDGNYGDMIPAVWAEVEMSIGSLCACAITYRPLLTSIARCVHPKSNSRHDIEAGASIGHVPRRQGGGQGVFTAMLARMSTGTGIESRKASFAVHNQDADPQDKVILEKTISEESSESSSRNRSFRGHGTAGNSQDEDPEKSSSDAHFVKKRDDHALKDIATVTVVQVTDQGDI